MNLKDLNNINIKDLKNIDWGGAKERLQSQPDLLFNILLAIITVVVLFSTYNKYKEMAETSKNKIEILQERLMAYEKLQSVQEQQRAFLSMAPKAINIDQFIQTLSEFAIDRNIQILAFSPVENKNNQLIQLTSVKVNVASESYEDLILFIHDIEESSYPIRITGFSGTADSPLGPLLRSSKRENLKKSSADTTNVYIKATLTLEAVELKNV